MVLAAVGLVFAGLVKGSAGFGLPMIALPVLASFVGPRTAVVVMSIVNFLSAAVLALWVRHVPLRAHARLLAPMLGALLVGVLVGAQLLASLNPTALSVLVGLAAIAFGLLSIFRVDPRVPPGRRMLVGTLVGLGSGLLGGTTSISATPIAIYFHAVRLAKDEFLLLLNLVLAFSSLVQLAAYAQLGLYTPPVLAAAALTVVCAGLGVVLGFVVQARVDQRIFNRFVVGVIFAVGLSLVARAVAG